ncbi:metallophosphoesterase [Persephonella sp.]
MYGNNYPIIFDALILLPSLGFPAIAEKREDGNYEIFVSMLCITPANESVDFTLSIPEILGIEKFKSYLNSDLDDFSKIKKFSSYSNPNQNIIKIVKLNEEKINKNWNKFYWIPQEDFIKIIDCRGKKEPLYKRVYKEAYAKARNLNGTSNLEVHHIEFILTIPQSLPSGLYNLVCKHERKSYKSTKSSFQYFLKNMIREKSLMQEFYGSSNIAYRGLQEARDIHRTHRDKNKGHDLSKTTAGKPAQAQQPTDGKNKCPPDISKTTCKKLVIPYHPVYIPKDGKKYLNIAHISDTHVSRRWNAMAYWANIRKGEYNEGKLKIQANGKDCSPEEGSPWDNFNNPNRRFEEALQKANKNSNVDIIIITGDLIDYNMGYCGDYEDCEKKKEKDKVQEDKRKKDRYFKHNIKSYYPNYNWVLFYELLLKNYEKPVFTILGNHDYRLAPYGVVTKDEPVIGKLTGEQNYADDLGIKVKGNDLDCLKKAIDFIYPQKMRKYFGYGSELKTSYDHVKWYNIVINPALDYMFTYGDMGFIFLDWRENEEIFGMGMKDFLDKYGIKLEKNFLDELTKLLRQQFAALLVSPLTEKNFLDELIKRISLPLPSFMKDFIALMKSFEKFGTPWAENVLTKKQRDMIRKMIKKLENKKAVLPTLIVSMHPTVFCGPSISYNDGKIVRDESRDDDIQQHLALGNFKKHRHWFIKQMYNFTRSGGRAIVLSGHAHKNRVYTIEDCKVGSKVKNIDREERKEKGEKKEKKEKKKKELPLFFIVTTSSAYISKEANSPGFRILTFKNQGKQMDVACVRLR